tara:strand:- start:127 stop:507 length:381 start_codon:yes stop_codon:yes gene_type:complete
MHFASKAIIFKKDKYLLQLRDNKSYILYPNHWSFFGGRFKKNETANNCLLREIKEELLINIKIIIKIYEGYNNKTGGYLNYFYAEPINGIKKQNLREGKDLGWFTKKEMKKLKLADDVKMVIDYLK